MILAEIAEDFQMLRIKIPSIFSHYDGCADVALPFHGCQSIAEVLAGAKSAG